MKILGLDEYRALRGSSALKYFELERVPDSNWIAIFESMFSESEQKVWVEGYCIVTYYPNTDISKLLLQLNARCEEANSIYRSKPS